MDMLDLHRPSVFSKWRCDIQDMECAGDADEQRGFRKVPSGAYSGSRMSSVSAKDDLFGATRCNVPSTVPECKGCRVQGARIEFAIADEPFGSEDVWVLVYLWIMHARP